ncbi:MAG: hypothetical protein DCC51_10165 [Anaerolineae bacterium]|nr:MAG: hypothetical protein DCC51_10165 [Anaerolineae bacterium]
MLAAALFVGTMPQMSDPTPVCDYEGSDYRARFWENQGRDYEDRAERVALRRLLPPTGRTLLDVGAGFGRLADEYRGYDRVVLFDFSRSLLREAQDHLRHDPRYLYVAGNWYDMPFVDGLFDALVQVRTLHHAADAPALFRELRRVAAPNAAYVLEFASKRNLKAMVRHAFGRQAWSPYDPEPVEFVALNFDFHPDWIRARLTEVGFTPGAAKTCCAHRPAGLARQRHSTHGCVVAVDPQRFRQQPERAGQRRRAGVVLRLSHLPHAAGRANRQPAALCQSGLRPSLARGGWSL